MPLMDRFITWGDRWFTHDAWHRVAFQPVLYLFMWGAVLRVVFTPGVPINFESLGGDWAYQLWAFLGIASPPFALLAWWMIMRCTWPRSTFLGIWMRLAADFGMMTMLLGFHLAAISCATCSITEVGIVRRYAVGAVLIFQVGLVLRDIWVIALTERVAGALQRAEDKPNPDEVENAEAVDGG